MNIRLLKPLSRELIIPKGKTLLINDDNGQILAVADPVENGARSTRTRVPRAGVVARRQRLLDLLADHKARTTSTAADQLKITDAKARSIVSNDLRRLADSGHIMARDMRAKGGELLYFIPEKK